MQTINDDVYNNQTSITTDDPHKKAYKKNLNLLAQ